jgi:hypothetical protein
MVNVERQRARLGSKASAAEGGENNPTRAEAARIAAAREKADGLLRQHLLRSGVTTLSDRPEMG